MPSGKWFPVDLQQEDVAGGFIVTLITDTPCHLWLYWTDEEPWVHRTSKIDRGLAVPWDAYWCFVAWNKIEQNEPGDTTTHTFTWLGWIVCQTKYFRFHGTINGVDSPSDSPILHKHYSYVPPAQYFFPFEPDKLYISASGTWVKVDSVLGGLLKDLLPSNAKVAFIHAVNRGSALRLGFRPTGSTHSVTEVQLGNSHTWAHVALDSNNEFEAFVGVEVDQDLYLMGYAVDPAVVMFPDPLDVTPLTGNAWFTLNLAAQCPGAIAILLEVSTDVVAKVLGVRKTGSADNRLGSIYHNWPVVGCDTQQRIDVYPQKSETWLGKVHVTGYITQSATFETNGIDKSLAIAGSYQQIDVPETSHLVFLEDFQPPTAGKLAMRPYGSAEDIYYQPNYRHIWIVAAPDDQFRLQGKIQDLNVDWWYLGKGT